MQMSRRELGERVLGHALDFLGSVEEAPTYRPSEERVRPPARSRIYRRRSRHRRDTRFHRCNASIGPGFATTSPRFMGYIPGGGLFHSGLGDLLAAVSNKYSGFAPAGPGAARVENACVDFLQARCRLSSGAGGTLTSGGSIANLTAIVVAREARDPRGGGAIYTTRFAHHCVDKALQIAGRGRLPHRRDCDRRQIPDAAGRASKRRLNRTSPMAVRPWLIVASAGTVDVGAVDPAGRDCRDCAAHRRLVPCRRRLWRPVHAVRGGRARLAGIELADSVALDPHKTLFLPYGTGAVLVRDGAPFARRAFSA